VINGVAQWPALAINYTTKTQYLFRINKGVTDISDNAAVNKFEPPRVLRRLFSLRGLSHEQEVKPVFTRGPRAGCTHGA